jgi:ComF family protein
MLKHLLNLFFPKSCAGCSSFLLKNELVICTQCRFEIPLTNHHNIEENEMVKKLYGRVPLEFACSLFYFHKKGIVQEMIHKLKYKGQEEIGEAIGYWYGEELKSVEIIQSADYIIPVPLHKKRQRKRGYNQVDAFGKALSKSLNIPFDESILKRNVYSKTQTKKNLLDRTEVKKATFEAYFDEKHHGKHFILIDDVITTGSTLEICSQALLKIPDAKISIVCMAMSHN